MLLATLRLLERDSGPILEDFPYDVDEALDEEGAACPVNFATVPPPQGELELLLSRFASEVMAMRTWYELAKEKNRRTTTGISGLDIDEIATLFTDFAKNGEAGPHLAESLTRASEDLLGYYLEAAAVQPGQSSNPRVLADWFWGATCAARVIAAVREKCLQLDDKRLQLVGKLLLIPRNQMHRFEAPVTKG